MVSQRQLKPATTNAPIASLSHEAEPTRPRRCEVEVRQDEEAFVEKQSDEYSRSLNATDTGTIHRHAIRPCHREQSDLDHTV